MSSEYSVLLEGVLSANYRRRPADRRAHLERLAQATVRLSLAYKQTKVSVDYSSRATQEAYLLRYYWPYSFLLDKVLRETKAIIPHRQNEVVSCFFGGGPGPELLGLMRYLERREDESRHLVSWIFDAFSEDWAYGRYIVEHSVLPDAWPSQKFELNSQAVDIGSPSMLEDGAVRRKLQAAHIVVFQNCLNEIASDYAPTQMCRVANFLAPGSTMVVIDRDGYGLQDKLRSLADWATSNGGYEIKKRIDTLERFDGRAIRSEIMATEAKYLYGDTPGHYACNLYLAWKVTYRWVAITKTPALRLAA